MKIKYPKPRKFWKTWKGLWVEMNPRTEHISSFQEWPTYVPLRGKKIRRAILGERSAG